MLPSKHTLNWIWAYFHYWESLIWGKTIRIYDRQWPRTVCEELYRWKGRVFLFLFSRTWCLSLSLLNFSVSTIIYQYCRPQCYMLLLPLIAKTGIFSYMLTIQIVIWSDIIRITANMKKDFKIAVSSKPTIDRTTSFKLN